MNKKIHFILSLVAFVLLFSTNNNHLHAQDSTYATLVTPKNFKEGITLDSIFFYKFGDKPEYAKPDFNDSDWRSVMADSTKNDTAFQNYKGILWYRGKFKIDTSLLATPFSIEVQTFGATEFYIDGQKVKTLGVLSSKEADYKSGFSMQTKFLPFDNQGKTEHTIAMRFAYFGDFEDFSININYSNPQSDHPFGTKIYPTNIALSKEGDFTVVSLLITLATVFLVLGLFHFILFVYYMKNRANLYYSLFTLLLFTMLFGLYTIIMGSDLHTTSWILKLELVSVFCVPLFFIGILYEIFYQRLLKLFWVLLVFIVISLTCYFVIDWEVVGGILQFLITMTIIIEIIRIFIRALIDKKDGARIFLFGLFFPVFGLIIMGVLSTLLKSSGFNLAGNYLSEHMGKFFGCSFLLSVNISMTFYLARDFARMNKKLSSQINEIQSLFNRTVEQENERKKILENQNEKLEQMVTLRTNEVMRQKTEIEIKNRDILDNLIYARRIQEAILPEIKLIYHTLQKSFIIYIPKDIVSGDFYSFSQKNDKVVIAAADCTGHGVTGAFMSMIGTSLLNQIINETGITEPGMILHDLNHGIVDALKQNENDVNDGMDIALCTIDLQNNSLVYAGANRPLWLFRDNEMSIIKPTKTAIGGFHANERVEFQEHSLQLKSGDTLYIFTDGYADQFGGPDGKKMLSKRFREILQKNQDLTMKEQEQLLIRFFHEWKGNYEQVDDILVIGIRL